MKTTFWWSHIFDSPTGEVDLLVEFDIDTQKAIQVKTSSGRLLDPDELADVQESIDDNIDLAGSWEKFQQDLIITDF